MEIVIHRLVAQQTAVMVVHAGHFRGRPHRQVPAFRVLPAGVHGPDVLRAMTRHGGAARTRSSTMSAQASAKMSAGATEMSAASASAMAAAAIGVTASGPTAGRT
jgi:hypothetical protein